MAEDEYGHLVLITALSVVDDTALLRKMIVAPLQVRSGPGSVAQPAWPSVNQNVELAYRLMHRTIDELDWIGIKKYVTKRGGA
eukprot:scaffold188423_cov18-Prasinocladus_malaysianus.AAC.1